MTIEVRCNSIAALICECSQRAGHQLEPWESPIELSLGVLDSSEDKYLYLILSDFKNDVMKYSREDQAAIQRLTKTPDGMRLLFIDNILNIGELKAEPIDPMVEVLESITKELSFARANWPAFNSAHEGFGVLAEEVDELWEHVKTKQTKRDLDKMKAECVQVAAMAIRFALDVCNEERGRK